MAITIGAVITNLLINTITDIRSKRVSILACILLTVVGIVGRILDGNMEPISLLTGVIPGLIMILISIISKGRLGLGDGIIVICMGLLMGVTLVIETLIIALFLVLIVSVVLLARKKVAFNSSLPFVPFLFVAFCILLIWV